MNKGCHTLYRCSKVNKKGGSNNEKEKHGLDYMRLPLCLSYMEPLMHGACGRSCNCSRLWSERPAEWGGPVNGAWRTSQRSRVLDSEPDISHTSLQWSRPIRAQRMKTTTYQPTKTSWTPWATMTAHKARPTLGKYNCINQGKRSADVKTLIG